MAKRVRKAVFPVAGLGTRFLPVTKAMPKEMLPVVDKPLIQYAFEEATAAGIEECYFVTGRAKNAIEDHFDTAAELEMTLRERGKDDLLNELDVDDHRPLYRPAGDLPPSRRRQSRRRRRDPADRRSRQTDQRRPALSWAAGSGAPLRLRREARLSRSQPRARSAASGIRRRATQADKDPSLTGNAGSAPSALAAVHDFSLAWSIRGPPRPQSFLASLAPLTATNEAGGVLRRTENRSVGATKSPRLTTSGSTSQRPRCDDYRPARAADALICKCPIQ